jgi:hypothetical protein
MNSGGCGGGRYGRSERELIREVELVEKNCREGDL